MDAVRVVVIDPIDASRDALQRLMQGLDSVWLTEVCKTYASAPKAVGDQAPNLAVINLDYDREVALALISELSRTYPRTAILPASAERAGELILRSMRAGAREFLTLPADPEELLSAIDRLVRPNANGQAPRLGGRVITFAGAAGGVGCTSLAVNLATTLARDDKHSVALADFDLLIGTVDACLDVVPDYTLLEVTSNTERLDLTLLKRSMTRHDSGVYVLPRPVLMEDAAKIDPEATRRVIALLKAAYSTVVIDTSKGLQASDFIAFEMADLIMVVVQLELTCLRNTARLLQVIRQVDGLAEKLRLVVNRNGFRDCQITTRKAEETLNLPLGWVIPDSAHEFAIARSRGVPLRTVFARSRVQKAIESWAHSLSEGEAGRKERAPRLRRFAAVF